VRVPPWSFACLGADWKEASALPSPRTKTPSMVALCLLAGCGAIQVRSQYGTPPPYSGVQYDVSGLSQVPHCVATATDWLTGVNALIITPALLVDLPLSFLVDTLFLPWEMRSEQGGWRPPPSDLCPPSPETIRTG
jgi:uncharacterized protein YceK